MKKRLLWIIVVLVILIALVCVLVGQFTKPAEPHETGPSLPEITEPHETEPDVTEPEVTEPEPTEPPHSALYIPDVSVEDVITYFNEVCLDSEFVTGGDPSVIQKWAAPIYYTLEGNYTGADLKVLTGFATWLNTIEGFPGIYPSTDAGKTNLDIHFCTQQKIPDLMGPNFTNTDGAVTFWYDYDIIYDAIICYRTDMSQHLRNSVILEEIYNGLGPVQDTILRPDSIIYQYYSEPQALTAVDELILRLLYHPDIKPGMNAEQCAEVIRKLYY